MGLASESAAGEAVQSGTANERTADRWDRVWSHRERLLKVARRRSMNAEDAEDAVHGKVGEMPDRPPRRLLEAAARHRRGTRALVIAGGYAVIVLAVAAFVIIDTTVKPGSIAAMWLFLVTLPGSLLLGLVPAQGTAYVLLLTLGGLVQAWLLWLVLRGKRVR